MIIVIIDKNIKMAMSDLNLRLIKFVIEFEYFKLEFIFYDLPKIRFNNPN